MRRRILTIVGAVLVATVFQIASCETATAQVHVVDYPAAPVVYAPRVAYRPVTVFRPAPVVYAPPVAAPVPVVVTRRRPLLGGTVSRVRTHYPPATFVAPVPVAAYYAPIY